MSLAALIYATRFTFEVRMDDVERMFILLRDGIFPRLEASGCVGTLAVGYEDSRMQRVDREKATLALEETSRRIVEDSDGDDERLEEDLAALRFGLLHGEYSIPFRVKKHRREKEYALLERELGRSENQERVRGLRIDLYVRYSGEPALVPGVHEIMGRDTGLLFKRSQVIRYTVHRSTIAVPAGLPMRTILTVRTEWSAGGSAPDAELMEKVKTLATVLEEHCGTLGTLFLKSVGPVVPGGIRWGPGGREQHPGETVQRHGRRGTGGREGVYEILTLHRDERTRISARRAFFLAYREMFRLGGGNAPEAAKDDGFPVEPVSLGYFTDDERATISDCTSTFGLLIGALL